MVYLNFKNNKNLFISIMKKFLKLFNKYEKYEFKKKDIDYSEFNILMEYLYFLKIENINYNLYYPFFYIDYFFPLN